MRFSFHAFTAAAVAALSFAFTPLAHADGDYPLYNKQGGKEGVFSIQQELKDATTSLAYAVVEKHFLQLYIPSEAVYVTLVPNNPIVTQKQQFVGAWMSYSNNLPFQCAQPQTDHLGNQRNLWGKVVYTNVGFNDQAVNFTMSLSKCNEPQEILFLHHNR